MRSVWALMVLLLQVFQGVEGYCDARQNNTICYGALGGTMEVQLMNNGSEIYRCIWRKQSQAFFDLKNDTIISNEFKNRSVFFFVNGTYRISNLTRNDSDTYHLEIYDKEGILTKSLTQQLFIEAPVSSVLLDSQCLSRGEMRVVCSAQGGDSPQYSWTLNGHPLTESQLLSKDRENNITLRQDVEGQLVCSVKNHISHIYKEQHISTCGCVLKKKCKKNSKEEEHEQELTYSDMRILKQPESQPQQTTEIEVQCGQVKFLEPRQNFNEVEENGIYVQMSKSVNAYDSLFYNGCPKVC